MTNKNVQEEAEESAPERQVHYKPASSDLTACGVSITSETLLTREQDEVTCVGCKPTVMSDEDRVAQNVAFNQGKINDQIAAEAKEQVQWEQEAKNTKA